MTTTSNTFCSWLGTWRKTQAWSGALHVMSSFVQRADDFGALVGVVVCVICVDAAVALDDLTGRVLTGAVSSVLLLTSSQIRRWLVTRLPLWMLRSPIRLTRRY